MVEGDRDRLHWHDYYEIGLCVKGEGKFIYLNKEYTVREGDIFLTNNFENHVAISEVGTKTEYIFLIFLPTFVADPNSRQLDLQYLLPFNYNPVSFDNMIKAGTKTADRVAKLLRAALSVYNKKLPLYELELDIKIREILFEFSKHYTMSEIGGRIQQSGFVNAKLQKIIRYMNLHFNERLTIEMLAEMIDMSPSYFRHMFRENLKISVKQYTTFLRMSAAKKLLLATDCNITEIIADVGYNNENQFYKTFKKHTQLYPAEYRIRHRTLEDSRKNQ